MTEKGTDATFAGLFALTSAARISVTDTCSILDVSREAWRAWRLGSWGMRSVTRARAEAMIHGVRYYIEQGVFPAHDRATHAQAVAKIRAHVDKKCLTEQSDNQQEATS
ncbi:MAG: hypothetical protein WC830_22160 [Burkholderiales bacterium]|jgi:hypothetical protein